MNELTNVGTTILSYDWSIFFKGFFIFFIILSIVIFFYDRFIQNSNQEIIQWNLINQLKR